MTQMFHTLRLRCIRPGSQALTAAATLLALSMSAQAQNIYTQPAGAPSNTGTNPAIAPAVPAQTPASGTPGPTSSAPNGSDPGSPIAAQPTGTEGMDSRGATANAAAGQLTGLSLFSINPPPPKKFAKHDLIEVIINESSAQNFSQTSDLKKNYSLKAELSKFPSLKALLEAATLEEGIGSVRPGVAATGNSTYKGEGKASRRDQVTARITATVVDVKPNGNLVIEARETIQSDRESTTMVISGTGRAEDITRNNTIQSSQLANLLIRIEHEGDVKDTSEKGLIPRVLEAVFNF